VYGNTNFRRMRNMKWVVHDSASKGDLELSAEVALSVLQKANRVIPKAKVDFLDKCLDNVVSAQVDNGAEDAVLVATELERDWLDSAWEVFDALLPEKHNKTLVDCMSNPITTTDEAPVYVTAECPNCGAKQTVAVDDVSSCEDCGVSLFTSCE
jgi:hypothetical protein